VFPATPFASAVAQAITIEGPMTTSTGNNSTGLPSGLILQSNATAGYVFDMIPGYEYAGLSSTGIFPIFKQHHPPRRRQPDLRRIQRLPRAARPLRGHHQLPDEFHLPDRVAAVHHDARR
jgi:hypothetical protein